MPKKFLLRRLHAYGDRHRALGLKRCDDWAGQSIVELAPKSLLDVGCGDGNFLFRYLKQVPRELHGIEGAPGARAKAIERGIRAVDCDLNGRWPFPEGKFDAILSSQVIEH